MTTQATIEALRTGFMPTNPKREIAWHYTSARNTDAIRKSGVVRPNSRADRKEDFGFHWPVILFTTDRKGPWLPYVAHHINDACKDDRFQTWFRFGYDGEDLRRVSDVANFGPVDRLHMSKAKVKYRHPKSAVKCWRVCFREIPTDEFAAIEVTHDIGETWERIYTRPDYMH